MTFSKQSFTVRTYLELNLMGLALNYTFQSMRQDSTECNAQCCSFSIEAHHLNGAVLRVLAGNVILVVRFETKLTRLNC